MATISGQIIEYVQEAYKGNISGSIERFRREHPDADITHINGNEVIGVCEVCRLPLTHCSRYYQDGDGVMWCASHGE